MNTKDQKRYELAQEVIYGRLKLSKFSILIGKSYGQSQRIIRGFPKVMIEKSKK